MTWTVFGAVLLVAAIATALWGVLHDVDTPDDIIPLDAPAGPFTSWQAARNECARRTFVTGEAHTAVEQPDGTWAILRLGDLSDGTELDPAERHWVKRGPAGGR